MLYNEVLRKLSVKTINKVFVGASLFHERAIFLIRAKKTKENVKSKQGIVKYVLP